jgi:hypothetical protein
MASAFIFRSLRREHPASHVLFPLPKLDVIDLTDTEIYGFEVDLRVAGHVDVLALIDVLFAVDLQEEGAFLSSMTTSCH